MGVGDGVAELLDGETEPPTEDTTSGVDDGRDTEADETKGVELDVAEDMELAAEDTEGIKWLGRTGQTGAKQLPSEVM